MAPIEEMHTAMVNRSVRTIKAELEFLCDASVITPQTLSDLLSKIPDQTALHAPISVGAVPSSNAQAGQLQPPISPLAALNVQNQNQNQPPSQPQNRDQNQNGQQRLNEKQDNFYQPPPAQAPPAYGVPAAAPTPSWPPLCQATALYAYTSADKGDLELAPNDHINVTEYLNAEWWKGRSSRTGIEGIFPRSYVRVIEQPPQPVGGPASYGNAPMEVAQGHEEDGKPGKGAEMGKKFGKKLGNAAIFGAGATIGSNIVNSIF